MGSGIVDSILQIWITASSIEDSIIGIKEIVFPIPFQATTFGPRNDSIRQPASSILVVIFSIPPAIICI